MQNKFTVPQKIKIEVPSDLQELDRLLLEFNRIYQEFIPCRDWLQCRLALAEGFTNAVKHAQKNYPREIAIEVEALLNRDSIEIKIWDRGSEFDLQNFITETAQKYHGWLSSGRGVPLLNKIADRLDYQRIDAERNCLIIFKQFANPQLVNE